MKKSKVLYTDVDEEVVWWLQRLVDNQLLPIGICLVKDIKEIDGDYLKTFSQCHFFAGIGGWALALKYAGVPTEAKVWTGSCPCQPFSNASVKAKGIHDPRHLWPYMKELISYGRPTTFFGEQVASKSGWDWLSAVRADMEGEKYAFGSAQLSAANVGLPHIRKRLYFVAHALQFRQGRMELKGQTVPCGFEPAQSKTDSHCVSTRGAFKPSSLPVLPVDGVSGQVAKLAIHGFGNAIVPELAGTFVRSSFEAINDLIEC